MIMKLRHGKVQINYACRRSADGSLKPTHGSTRQATFCPDCQFDYKAKGCIFTPASTNGTAFGRKISTKPRRDYAPRRKAHNSNRQASLDGSGERTR